MLDLSFTHKSLSFSKSVYSKASVLSPIENVIKELKTVDKILNKEKLIFCYKAISRTLHAYLEGNYTAFDALTATTCCHGISLLVHHLIDELSQTDVEKILSELNKALEQIETITFCHLPDLIFFQKYCLPEPILMLTQIYLLSNIKEKNDRKGWRTVVQKLKEIAPISITSATTIINRLQSFYSNLVAESYINYFLEIKADFVINTIPIGLWGKYIQEKYIKVDRRGRKYAPCLYSTQITLAYLIQHRLTIAVVDDIKFEDGSFRERYIRLLEGDGDSKLNLINIEDINSEKYNHKKPVIVFGGCTHSNKSIESIKNQLELWIQDFQGLVLASDTFDDQYPFVGDDPNFDNTPIEPHEIALKHILNKYKNTTGVSAQDPSIFCLTHIYAASLKQIVQEINGLRISLVESFIPLDKRCPNNLDR